MFFHFFVVGSHQPQNYCRRRAEPTTPHLLSQRLARRFRSKLWPVVITPELLLMRCVAADGMPESDTTVIASMNVARIRQLIGFGLRQTGVALENMGAAVQGDAGFRETLNRHRSVMPLGGKTPVLTPRTFVAPSASVIGDVSIGENSSVWYNAVVSGKVSVGSNSNILESSVVTAFEASAVSIGSNVVIEQGAILKGCTIEDSAFVGMRATVQEGAVVKTGAFVSAGAVVSSGTTVPSGEVWAGCPAVFLRKCTVGEIDSVNAARDATTKLAAQHADENSKSFAEVEQERLQRQLLAERDADYDSSLGLVGSQKFDPKQAAKFYSNN